MYAIKKIYTQFWERKVVNFPYLMCILQSLPFQYVFFSLLPHSLRFIFPFFVIITTTTTTNHCRQHLFVWKCNTILIFVNKIHIWCTFFFPHSWTWIIRVYVCACYRRLFSLYSIFHFFFSKTKCGAHEQMSVAWTKWWKKNHKHFFMRIIFLRYVQC